MKRIAFNLYGTGLKYLYGMVRNIHICEWRYPGYVVTIWYEHSTLPAEWLKELTNATLRFKNVQMIDAEAEIPWYAPCEVPKMFWRFFTHLLPETDLVLTRDADSRPTRREVVAVREWEESGKLFHTMRDHPAHRREINGGMWGWRAPFVEHLEQKIEHFLRAEKWKPGDPEYGLDQTFLCRYIWPHVKDSCVQHDSFVSGGEFGECRPFVVAETLQQGQFVGEVFDVRAGGVSGPHGDIQMYIEEPRIGDRNSRGR